MEDPPAKMTPKEKPKKVKTEKKKLKVEGDVTQPDEFIKPEPVLGQPTLLESQQPTPQVSEKIIPPTSEQSTTRAAVKLESPPPEKLINPENVKEEMTKLKHQLLQSVAENEALKQLPQVDSLDSENQEQLVRIRERSSSRPYEIPTPAAPSYDDVLKEIDDTRLLELKEAFLLFDLDGDGCISHSDLRGTLISLGYQVDDDYVRKMISEAMSPLDFDAFVLLLGYKTVDLDSEETLIDALSQWDYAGTGLVSEKRIRHDLMTWGDRFTQKEVDYALEEAPIVQKNFNTEKMIDYIRFCNILCGLKKPSKKFNQ